MLSRGTEFEFCLPDSNFCFIQKFSIKNKLASIFVLKFIVQSLFRTEVFRFFIKLTKHRLAVFRCIRRHVTADNEKYIENKRTDRQSGHCFSWARYLRIHRVQSEKKKGKNCTTNNTSMCERKDKAYSCGNTMVPSWLLSLVQSIFHIATDFLFPAIKFSQKANRWWTATA